MTLSHPTYVDLSPWLIRAFLVLFLVDIAIRRWENVLGIATVFQRD